ncbi:MAG: GNAT family N-acetyltransferase [Alphaproteobacteria bacterium]|nr:GNAT family N-acetyltransferase [Alphaproteobacteria bacterium]
MIVKLSKEAYEEIVELWEASVRATHGFISEEDILYYRDVVYHEFLSQLEVYGIVEKELQGFMGVQKNRVEMLFISPKFFHQGLGTKLMKFAIDELGIDEVDVNEQNPKAYEFYQKLGFKMIYRKEQDASGRPYPVLFLKLK